MYLAWRKMLEKILHRYMSRKKKSPQLREKNFLPKRDHPYTTPPPPLKKSTYTLNQFSYLRLLW